MTAMPPAVMRTPRSMEVELTTRCNLACCYCSLHGQAKQPVEDLPTEQWADLFTEMGELGVMDVTLTGGEVLVRPDIQQLIEKIVRSDMRFQLVTNGSLVTNELADFLSSTQHCNCIQVPLDGSSAAVHDICRGAGAFEGAVRGIRILQAHKLPVTVRATVQHHNIYDLENIAAFLLDELGLPFISTNAAGYLGACRLNLDDVFLTIAERQYAIHTLLELDARYPERIQAVAGPLADGRAWMRMEEARLQGSPAFATGGRLTGCSCIFNQLSVRADGAFVPCKLLSQFVLGWMGKDSLIAVWQNSPTLVALRQRREIPLLAFSVCQDCAYKPYCTGSCPALAFAQTGQVDHPNPDACLRSYLLAGGQL